MTGHSAEEASPSEQYADATNLNARVRLHQRFSVNPTGFVNWLFDQLSVPEGAVILEVGGGPGWFWRTNQHRTPTSWRVFMTDLSEGMLAQAMQTLGRSERNLKFCVCDAEALPFESDSMDALLANHMLYHVPNLEFALSEFTRVLKDDGTLYAATNGQCHLWEIDELVSRVAPGTRRLQLTSQPFSLDNGGACLRRHFQKVVKKEYPDELRVTESAALIEYIESCRSLSSDVRHHLVDLIDGEIASKRHFRVAKDAGLFIAKGHRIVGR